MAIRWLQFRMAREIAGSHELYISRSVEHLVVGNVSSTVCFILQP